MADDITRTVNKILPPQLSPSPDGRSYSPSKSSETPADSSAGTSTADVENVHENISVLVGKTKEQTGNTHL